MTHDQLVVYYSCAIETLKEHIRDKKITDLDMVVKILNDIQYTALKDAQ